MAAALRRDADKRDCAECGEPIAGAIYFPGRYPYGTTIFCEACYRAARTEQVRRLYEPLEEDFDPDQVFFIEASPCEACGREVAFLEPKRRSSQAHVCSFQCGRELDNAVRRVTPKPKACEVCGETFTPRRSDAKTCSDRCRQAKRRRT